MAPLSGVPDAGEHAAARVLTIKKPPPIFIDLAPSEFISTAIAKLITQLKVSASFRHYNYLQYMIHTMKRQLVCSRQISRYEIYLTTLKHTNKIKNRSNI